MFGVEMHVVKDDKKRVKDAPRVSPYTSGFVNPASPHAIMLFAMISASG
jgi:hypothetical protein